ADIRTSGLVPEHTRPTLDTLPSTSGAGDDKKMISTSASSPSMGRKRCRQGARRKGGAAHEAVRRTVLVCCCYVVAVAGGRFAAAFTAVPPLAPLPSSAHGDRAHVHTLKSEPSRRGGVFTSAAEAEAG
ncbi:unnamed protein product, partial [Scytosiphon promiscuus]